MKGFINEFKEFISRGSVMDMAVGIIIGSAFTSIINAFVDEIIMPLITLLTGNIDFSDFVIPLTPDISIGIGVFISAVISFLLIALVIFFMIKAMNAFRKNEDEPETTKVCPFCKTEIDIDATRCPNCTSIIVEEGKSLPNEAN